MRLDRILTEGEAVIALQKLGFTVREAPNRIGQYIVAHTQIGGERTFTVEQLCSFSEGAVVISTHLTAGSATIAAR